jgi:hypothetical protein
MGLERFPEQVSYNHSEGSGRTDHSVRSLWVGACSTSQEQRLN